MTRQEFERAVERARPRLVGRAAKRLDRDAAEDAAQDAVVIALQKSDWTSIQSVDGWLLGIVDNVVNNTMRAVRFTAELDENLIAPGGDLLDQIIERDETERQIDCIMDAAGRAGLTPRETAIFHGRFADQSYGQIATELGCTESTARGLHCRALGKIRVAIGEK